VGLGVLNLPEDIALNEMATHAIEVVDDINQEPAGLGQAVAMKTRVLLCHATTSEPRLPL